MEDHNTVVIIHPMTNSTFDGLSSFKSIQSFQKFLLVFKLAIYLHTYKLFAQNTPHFLRHTKNNNNI